MRKNNMPKKFNRGKKFVWYLYHFLMIIICIITIVVFWGCKQQVVINLNFTTIMLGVIGFLFAFAGINIYSIFNTNIDEEKDRLKQLQDNYITELVFTKDQWSYSQELLMYYQLSQLITESKEFNAQIYDWVFSLKKHINSFSKYLDGLYKTKEYKLYFSFKDSLLVLTRGMEIQLKSFENKISKEDSLFFNNITDHDKDTFLNVFKDNIINEITNFGDSLQKYSFPRQDYEEINGETGLSFIEKVKILFSDKSSYSITKKWDYSLDEGNTTE